MYHDHVIRDFYGFGEAEEPNFKALATCIADKCKVSYGLYPMIVGRPTSKQQMCVSHLAKLIDLAKLNGGFKNLLSACGASLGRALFYDDEHSGNPKNILLGKCFKNIPTVEELR